MQTENKEIYKSKLFWEITISAATLLCVLAFLIVALTQPRQSDSSSDASTQQSEQSQEVTLPPPDKNPIGMGDFAMENGYLTCLSTPSVMGIDVSYWQGEIDWQQVKDAGVEFAMIRVGYRGTESGILYADDYASANYAGATAVGISVGAYYFSQAVTVQEALDEAEHFLQLTEGWDLQMPVVYDWEYAGEDARTANLDARTITDCTKAFCEKISGAGFQPMVYFNAEHASSRLYLRELTAYPFWLAQYDTVLDYPYKIDMWQYSETGTVPGIAVPVDINLYFPWEVS